MSKKSGKTEPKGKGSTDRNAARPAKPRRVKLGKYRSFRLQKRIRHPVRLPNVWRITRKAALTLWEHKWLFAGITLVYGFLNLALAQGVAGGTDVSSLKESLRQVFTGHFGFVPTSLSIFAVMVS